ncbi:glycosyltransferase [Candidatus Pelagibacter sp. Uisw_137]|uniref:glycosyltransferase n=1 Tax=Candidatus Pelagibacter sp. Uisw_137 TaxID=3230992 RepID=UPI0039EB8EBE
MKKKIFYWSPCLNPVGTVKSTLNSAVSAVQYGSNFFDVTLINACGEWDEYLDYFKENHVKIINFKYKFFKYLPKHGYIQSRFSYIIIFLFCFFPLIKLIKSNKPEFFIAHLITSLPLTIMNLLKTDTKFILRISGMPKLNLIRKSFWKIISAKLYMVTSPSIELMNKLININLFDQNKISFLPDAIIDIKQFIFKKNSEIQNFQTFDKKRLIFAAGRLTKQKNFSYLIDEFSTFLQNNKDFILLILGDGEERSKLEKQIIKKKLQTNVYLIGHVNNVFKYFKKGEVFVLSSLWEEVGFVMVEAALTNLFVISSNCPNGPKEFLSDGRYGILFENNKKGELSNSLIKYTNLKDLKKHKFEIKKNTKQYTKYRHFLKLKNILKNNIN